MDKPTLLVRQIGTEVWIEPESSSYTNEAHLQELLTSDPTRIPGIPPGSLAVKELSTSSGPIDICIVSLSGAITVVEDKQCSGKFWLIAHPEIIARNTGAAENRSNDFNCHCGRLLPVCQNQRSRRLLLPEGRAFCCGTHLSLPQDFEMQVQYRVQSRQTPECCHA